MFIKEKHGKTIQVDDLGSPILRTPLYVRAATLLLPVASATKKTSDLSTCRLLGTEHMGMQYVPSGTLT